MRGEALAATLAMLPVPALAAAADGAALFQDRCAMCHSGDPMAQGPSLSGVVGRKAGSVAGFAYSPAMRAAGLVWTKANLDRFLADPQKTVPGDAMPVHVADPATRAAIIEYLSRGK